MPGGSRVRFRWKDNKPPWYLSTLAVIFVLTFFLWIGFDFIVPYIGARVPDSHRTSAVAIFGGTYYIRHWAAWFRDSGGWIPGSFLVALLLVEFAKGYYVPRAR